VLNPRRFRGVDVVGVVLVLLIVEVVARELDLLAVVLDVAGYLLAHGVPDDHQPDYRRDHDERSFQWTSSTRLSWVRDERTTSLT
jgi:hypothetical protein